MGLAEPSAAPPPAPRAAPPTAPSAAPSAEGRLPSFLMIGATKAGSTSLFDWLRAHPDVYMHPTKELRYFTAEHNLGLGEDWYRAQFADAGGATAVGEASNAYARAPAYAGVPARVRALIPEARLVYLVREPFRRLESHYRWRLSTGYEWRPPARALRDEPSYLAASLYGAQVAAWAEHFDPSRILVLQAEALFRDPAPHLERLCAHLGVPWRPDLPYVRRNETEGRAAVPRPLRHLARGPLRRPMRRWGKRIAASRWGALAGGEASRADWQVPRGLRGEIARTFAEDRRRLADLAGCDVVEGWPHGWPTR